MKRRIVAILLILAALAPTAGAYIDHRGHNLDSLERVVAAWTPERIDNATDGELAGLVGAWDELMLGYCQINPVKCEYYARRISYLAGVKAWADEEYSAFKMLGQMHWASERYDSASFYYSKALAAIDRMSAGAGSPLMHEQLTQKDTDDLLSMMYGTLGNLYSSQDSLERAMYYYGKAGELFKKYAWYTSCAVLYSNMGSTWFDAGDIKIAGDCYEEALAYSIECGDSLWLATAYRGLGQVCLERGRLGRARKYLREADAYFSKNQGEEPAGRIETLDVLDRLSSVQKRVLALSLILSVSVFVLLLLLGIVRKKLNMSRKQNEEAADFIVETLDQMPAAGEIKLNDRELAIIRSLADGKESSEIAEELFLSLETIKWYRKRLLVKFDVTSSAALVAAAFKKGLL